MDNGRRSSAPLWTTKSVAAMMFFALYLLVQIGVPLARLRAPRPARFGWQMFSAVNQQRARFTLVMRDGTKQPVNLSQYVALSRGELELEKALPPHLCRVVSKLASVEITKPDSPQPREYKCR
jgi:hypothetical protein